MCVLERMTSSNPVWELEVASSRASDFPGSQWEWVGRAGAKTEVVLGVSQSQHWSHCHPNSKCPVPPCLGFSAPRLSFIFLSAVGIPKDEDSASIFCSLQLRHNCIQLILFNFWPTFSFINTIKFPQTGLHFNFLLSSA